MNNRSHHDDKIKNPTVQDIIDRLMQVEDKTQPFEVEVYGVDGFSMDYVDADLAESVNSEGRPVCVVYSVYLTGK